MSLAIQRVMNRWSKRHVVSILTAAAFSACGQDDGVSTSLGNGGGLAGGTGVTNSVSSPAEMAVGDIMPITYGESGNVSVNFSGVDGSAEFIMVLGSASTSGSGAGSTVQTSTDIAVEIDVTKGIALEDDEVRHEDDERFGTTEIFHAWIRASEDSLAESEIPAMSKSSFGKASLSKSVSEGDIETFRVLASLTGVSSYVEVEAEVRYVGDEVVIYVDTDVSSSQLSSSDIESLCAQYDRVAAEEIDLLGSPSDVDGDGRVHVLFTPQVNRLGALGGGVVTGYFYAGDLYARSSSNQVSNAREILHLMVPDPSGQYGVAISHSFALSNLLSAVFPHELQHAISYNQHVFVKGGAAETGWLNEGMSHLIEDVLGYGVENPSRYALFLSSPSSTSLVASGSPDLLERGAAFLFLRFLYEQSADGSSFLRGIVQSNLTGVSNVEGAFTGSSDDFDQFSEFFGRWTVALAMTDRGITSDSRYVYQSRSKHAETGNWEGVCLSCNSEDNRSTSLTGVHLSTFNGYHSVTIAPSAAKFYKIASVPNTVSLQGTSSSDFGMLIRTE